MKCIKNIICRLRTITKRLIIEIIITIIKLYNIINTSLSSFFKASLTLLSLKLKISILFFASIKISSYPLIILLILVSLFGTTIVIKPSPDILELLYPWFTILLICIDCLLNEYLCSPSFQNDIWHLLSFHNFCCNFKHNSLSF